MAATAGGIGGERDSGQAVITTREFTLSPRAYLMLFVTRGRGWWRFLAGYVVRVVITAALIGYLTESWRNGEWALLVVGGTAALVLAAAVIGGWLWIHRVARRGECVRFAPVYYTLDEHTLTLHGADGACCEIPLIRVQRMVRTPRYCLLHVERGLFHCVPVAAFGSEAAVRRCESWLLAADVPVQRLW